MKTDQIIEKLNEAVSLEFGAFHMYLQFSLLIHGKDRIKWHEFFEGQSQEALGHARLFAGKIVARGGIPTHKSAPFKQAQDLDEMLELALETEKRAVQLYTKIHGASKATTSRCNICSNSKSRTNRKTSRRSRNFSATRKLHALRVVHAA